MSFGSTILIVDDERNARDGLKQFLIGLNYDVLDSGNGKEAVQIAKRERPDVVLTDLKMPDMDGVEVLHQIKRTRPETIVILLTAYGTVENAVQAMKAGAYYYLTKPINLEELELTLKKALHQRQLERENISLRQELLQEKHETGEIIGESEPVKKLIALAKQVAKSDSTVLIQGESGTGKELVAKALHDLSQRKEKAFIAINCSAIPATLIESELFGYKKGAFTGADTDSRGKTKLAVVVGEV